MTTENESDDTNYAIIDGHHYGLINGNVSDAPEGEVGYHVHNGSWRMELLFTRIPRYLYPLSKKALDISVTLWGTTYTGKVTLNFMHPKQATKEQSCICIFEGVGPLVSDQIDLAQ